MTACMGGWCAKRDHCTHYHCPDKGQPAERLCAPGETGAYVAINLHTEQPEPAPVAELTTA